MTSPSWMPLLMIAGAVVTDLGGLLSHAAIVAREFGVPAVTGTRHATNWCISEREYRVNGDAGVVLPLLGSLE
jgi:phosphoenolpyruvate synthase/pyruvate phosphate dikinase